MDAQEALTVPRSLSALLWGIVDYAGLFPPASLPLEEAIRNYAHYRQEPDRWALGRFICPTSRLHELGSEALLQSDPPFAFSALATPAELPQTFRSTLTADVESIRAFQRHHGERARVEVLELRLPHCKGPSRIATLVDETIAVLQSMDCRFPLFFEAQSKGSQSDLIAALKLKNAKDEVRQRCGRLGFKLRCGGLTPSAFPTSSQVAGVLHQCANADVPIKFTAGLHHPLRHFSDNVGTTMHGFVNVFTAAVLAKAHALQPHDLITILETEKADQFHFGEQLQWQTWAVSAEQIRTIRQQSVISFGSCSFDEPREDLRALGWLN